MMFEKNLDKFDLTALDRKLLYLLDMNSRFSLSELAKKTRSSPSAVDYRLKRLEKNGLIKNYLTFLDAGKLGLMIWNIYFQFQNMDNEVEGKIQNYLCSIHEGWWVASCSGNWDMILSVCVHNVKELYSTITKVHNKFGQYISKQNIVAHAEIEIISRGYFNDEVGSNKIWYVDVEKHSVDEIDKHILQIIASNARMPSTEIAQKINSTARIVMYRIKQLEKKGIIHKYRLALDVKKIGLSFYKVIIWLKDFTSKKNQKLKQYCIQEKNIIHYEQKVGAWMLELELDSPSYEDANKQLKKMKEKFSDFIQIYELLLITEEHKAELDLTKYL